MRISGTYIFGEELDCWSRVTSDFDEDPVEVGSKKLYEVFAYCLDSAMMDSLPLERRLLFMMGSTLDSYVTSHKSIAIIFEDEGSRLVPLA